MELEPGAGLLEPGDSSPCLVVSVESLPVVTGEWRVLLCSAGAAVRVGGGGLVGGGGWCLVGGGGWCLVESWRLGVRASQPGN